MRLAESLRSLADEHQHPLVGWERRLVGELRRAADAIEKYEAALRGIVDTDGIDLMWARTVARAALTGEGGDGGGSGR